MDIINYIYMYICTFGCVHIYIYMCVYHISCTYCIRNTVYCILDRCYIFKQYICTYYMLQSMLFGICCIVSFLMQYVYTYNIPSVLYIVHRTHMYMYIYVYSTLLEYVLCIIHVDMTSYICNNAVFMYTHTYIHVYTYIYMYIILHAYIYLYVLDITYYILYTVLYIFKCSKLRILHYVCKYILLTYLFTVDSMYCI